MASLLPRLLCITICVILYSIVGLNSSGETTCTTPCSCETTPLLYPGSNSDLNGHCLCPEHGTFPSNVTNNVLKLDVKFIEPVVLGNTSFPTFSKLRHMNISGVHFILPEGLQGLRNITKLVLHNNFMRVLEKDMFNNLDILNNLTVEPSEKNKIHALENGTFLGLTNLHTLILSRNSISVIEGCYFRDLSEVTKIDLSHNALAQIAAKTFIYTHKLKELNLTDNSITLINRNAFLGLTQLRFLRLEDNFIQSMPKPVFQIGSLPHSQSNDQRITVFLDGNPIRCGCQMNWLFEWLKSDRKHCEGVCIAPYHFQNRSLSDVYKLGLCKCHKNNSIIHVNTGDWVEIQCPEQGTKWVTPGGRVLQEHGECVYPYSFTNIESLVIWKASPEHIGKFSCFSSDGTQEFQYEVDIKDNSSLLNGGELAAVIVSCSVVAVGIIMLIVKCRTREGQPGQPLINVDGRGEHGADAEPESGVYQRAEGATAPPTPSIS